MEKEIYEIIRECLNKDSALTQKGLAEVLDVNPAAVNRMLHGMRQIKANEIPIIERYIGAKLDLANKSANRMMNAMNSVGEMMHAEATKVSLLIPVYDEKMVLIDEVEKNFLQSFKSNVFAIYIKSNNMEPRYFYGEMIYLQKGRPPEKHRDCLIELNDGRNLLLNFIDATSDKIKVQQFNPLEVFEFKTSAIKAISSVIGRN